MLSGMDRRTQQDYIGWRAPDLARSGLYRNWAEIVRMLRFEGAYGAHKELTSPFMRERLNRLCDEARAMLSVYQEKDMGTEKDHQQQAEDRWDAKARAEHLCCERCHLVIPYSDRDVYFRTHLCVYCASHKV